LVGPQAAWAQGASDDASQTAPAADEGAGEEAPETTGRRAAPPSGVEVIRIKGRAVTGIETEVPASVTQFDAGDLQELGAQNISDLAKVTPNVEIKTSGSTSPTFFIRGVGLSDFSANAAGAVAIYRDDVAINAPAIQLTPIFDLENVEVLRGPQGPEATAPGRLDRYSRKPTETWLELGPRRKLRLRTSRAPSRRWSSTRCSRRGSPSATERGPTARHRCGPSNGEPAARPVLTHRPARRPGTAAAGQAVEAWEFVRSAASCGASGPARNAQRLNPRFVPPQGLPLR
jgi:hypothetical protein